MHSLRFDLRDALRGLRRDRGYTLASVFTLALTIGATTAVFSIVNSVLLEPLAYAESHRLVALHEAWKQFADKIPVLEVNANHFEYWRRHSQTFDSMAQYIVRPGNLTGAGDAAEIDVGRCSGSLFDVLRVRAAVGRALAPADESIARPAVAVLTDSLWRRRFGGDPGVVGRSLVLDGEPRTIVGVLAPDFQLPTTRSTRADLFVPIKTEAENVGWEGDHNNEAVGRLRAGATMQQAHAELDVLQAQVSDIATKEAGQRVTLASIVTPLAETIVGRARAGLLLLLAAVVAVLAIACSNLANLSLTRATSRLRDAAIRTALGAARSRQVARAVVEQLLLSAAGGALGIGIACAALVLFVKTAPVDLPRAGEVALDARVLAFAAAVSIASGLLVAILPAWRTSGTDLEQSLRAGAPAAAGDRAAARTRGALLALQVALSLTLLVVTALLTASFVRLMNVDRGFVADRALVVPVSMPAKRYADEAARLAAYDRLIASVREIPGIQTASTTSAAPLSGTTQVNTIAMDGSTAPRSEQPSANYRFVGPDFFRALGIAVVRGRAFADGEGRGRGTMPALVSDRTAARIWPGQDPIGKRFSRGIPGEAGFEVVGVAADAKLTSLDRTPPLMVYLPYWWRTRPSLSLVVRTAADPAGAARAVREAVRAIDPDIAIGDARPLEEVVSASMAGRRYQMRLFVAFGAVALFIATLGVYASTSYGVSRRRREMNIRVALGARPSEVMRLVVRQGTAPIAIGLGAGAIGALAVGGLVASLLFDVRPRDPFVLAAAIVLVGGAGTIACAMAARQGLRIDPAQALREE